MMHESGCVSHLQPFCRRHTRATQRKASTCCTRHWPCLLYMHILLYVCIRSSPKSIIVCSKTRLSLHLHPARGLPVHLVNRTTQHDPFSQADTATAFSSKVCHFKLPETYPENENLAYGCWVLKARQGSRFTSRMWRWSTQQHHALALADRHRASRSGFEVLKICQERKNSVKGSLIFFFLMRRTEGSLGLCCVTEKQVNISLEGGLVGPGSGTLL